MTNSTRRSLRERTAQFSDQVQRRLAGELNEDQFRPLRLMNGLYLQLHAYMLRIAVPYGTLSSQADAHAGPYRPHLRPRLRPLHDAAEHPVQLAQAARHPGDPRGPRLGRDARHPDLGQLHPQHHDRPVRRRRGRRDHRSASGRRNPAPVVEPPSRILVPAAQVQDRDDRRAERPRRDPLPRYRPAGGDQCRRAKSAGKSGSAAASAARR